MPIGEIDPVEDRNAVTNEPVEQSPVFATFLKLTDCIGKLFEAQKFVPQRTTNPDRQTIQLLNDLPVHKQPVRFQESGRSSHSA